MLDTGRDTGGGVAAALSALGVAFSAKTCQSYQVNGSLIWGRETGTYAKADHSLPASRETLVACPVASEKQ